MCGIAGILRLSNRLSPDEMKALATRMADSFKHRGPDDWGVWLDPSGTCALSQRRLSIIDLSPLGHQPMVDEASGCALTFNGEVYNFQELRKELVAQGRTFRGTSDTEVLLHSLIDKNNTDTLNKLDGMFAFGFFDGRTKTLTLARDMFGEKPLYYARTKDWFAFASELQALTCLPDFDNRVTLDTITTYLMLQYVAAPRTIFEGANKLPPAHIMTIDARGQTQTQRYYAFKPSSLQTGTRSMDDLADELETILTDTIRTRLISDVPLGAFLSGGVDSSLVVALASKQLNKPIKTFSIGFEGHEDSEHENARAMAEHLRTEHHDRVLPLNALETGKYIAKILDEPNGDTSCLPTWILSRMTRKHVTVALSGDGGDELFGGYGRYYRTLQDANAARGNPDWSVAQTYYSPRILVFGDAAIEKFIGYMPPRTLALLRSMREPLDRTNLPVLNRLRETDAANYMPGAVLAKVDRMSMQHALEVRAPLLGRKVADFAAQMAADDLCTAVQTKRLLKHLAARHIPRTWLDRPKMGFGLPVQGWGGNELTRAVRDLLFDRQSKLGQWIDMESRSRFVDYHSKTPVTYQLWEVFILEHWLREHAHRAA